MPVRVHGCIHACADNREAVGYWILAAMKVCTKNVGELLFSVQRQTTGERRGYEIDEE